MTLELYKFHHTGRMMQFAFLAANSERASSIWMRKPWLNSLSLPHPGSFKWILNHLYTVSTGGHLACFQFFPFFNTYVNLLDFAKVLLMPVVAICILTSQAVDESSFCSMSSPNLGMVIYTPFNRSVGYEIISHCSFNLHFPNYQWNREVKHSLYIDL